MRSNLDWNGGAPPPQPCDTQGALSPVTSLKKQGSPPLFCMEQGREKGPGVIAQSLPRK